MLFSRKGAKAAKKTTKSASCKSLTPKKEFDSKPSPRTLREMDLDFDFLLRPVPGNVGYRL